MPNPELTENEYLEAIYHALTAGKPDAALRYALEGLGPRRVARLESTPKPEVNEATLNVEVN